MFFFFKNRKTEPPLDLGVPKVPGTWYIATKTADVQVALPIPYFSCTGGRAVTCVRGCAPHTASTWYQSDRDMCGITL